MFEMPPDDGLPCQQEDCHPVFMQEAMDRSEMSHGELTSNGSPQRNDTSDTQVSDRHTAVYMAHTLSFPFIDLAHYQLVLFLPKSENVLDKGLCRKFAK